LGIPPGLPGLEDMSKLIPHWERLWGFHDTQLSSRVRNAFHALAIDETREAFEPTLWTNVVQVPGQTVEQVWFAGVHTEVGGGSSDAALSDIALLWMVEKATGCGLVIRPGLLECGASNGAGGLVEPNYAGPIVDSRTGVFAFMRPYHRLRKLHDPTPDQRIASSVARRAGARELHYAPDGLEQYRDALDLTPVTEECPAAVPDAHTDADRSLSGAEV
jgi:hypothetical protein